MSAYYEDGENFEYNNTNHKLSHGASISIRYDLNLEKLVHHKEYIKSTPAFRSYRDGVRIGCTFVSSEALEYVWKKHTEYLTDQKEYKEHQAGEL